MSERKVLNKYFPAEYDPSKIPRLPKGTKSLNRQFNLRTMAPFNMRCLTCKTYIYRAKKFNSRMELAEGETYLGLRQYRFHIRCPTCCSEIIWRSDLETSGYVLESGAERNFEALYTAIQQEEKKEKEFQEELANNPMKMLEHRTNASRNEMDMLETLEEMKQLNRRQAGMEMTEQMLAMCSDRYSKENAKLKEEEDQFVKEALASRFKKIEENFDEHKSQDSLSMDQPGSSSNFSASDKPKVSASVLQRKLLSQNSLKEKLKGVVVKRPATSSESTVSPNKQTKLDSTLSTDTTVSSNDNLLGLNYSDSESDSS